MKKRIFIVQNTPLNEPLPLSVYLTGLLSNYKKSKEYEFNLIVSKSKDIPKEITKTFNKIYHLNTSTYSVKDNMKFSLETYKILKKENKKSKVDIVHCLYPNSSLLGAVLFKSLNKWKTKIIYDVRSPWIEMSIERGFINKYLSNIYKTIIYAEEAFLCKFVRSFMFITPGLAGYYKEKVGIGKNQIVYDSPSGVDLKVFKRTKSNIRSKYRILKGEILVGSVGGITNERKPWEILEVFASLIKEDKRIKLMLIGGRDAIDNLKELSKKLKIEKNIIFTGNIPHNEIPKYISAFDWGLAQLPNNFIHRNNFSLKILEYLACGIPVLASKIKSNEEIAKKINEVYIYRNSKDIKSILNKHSKFVMPENIKDYSWPSLVDKYWRMYKKI